LGWRLSQWWRILCAHTERVGVPGADSAGPLGVETMKKPAITVWSMAAALVLAILALCVAWWSYDPTVAWSEADGRLQAVIGREFNGQAQIVERKVETQYPNLIPFLIKYHPRYVRQPRAVTGSPDNSGSLVIEVSGAQLRCYFHLCRGRAVGFSVLCHKGDSAAATRLGNGIKRAFPGLRVTVQESDTLQLPLPDGAGLSSDPEQLVKKWGRI
jgi:hypothetical protein